MGHKLCKSDEQQKSTHSGCGFSGISSIFTKKDEENRLKRMADFLKYQTFGRNLRAVLFTSFSYF